MSASAFPNFNMPPNAGTKFTSEQMKELMKTMMNNESSIEGDDLAKARAERAMRNAMNAEKDPRMANLLKHSVGLSRMTEEEVEIASRNFHGIPLDANIPLAPEPEYVEVGWEHEPVVARQPPVSPSHDTLEENTGKSREP
jgi:hypothetical protein